MNKKRIVITGMGAVTANGLNSELFLRNTYDNISGLDCCTRYDVSKLRGKMVGEVDYEALEKKIPNDDQVEKTIYLAYVAACEALEQANISYEELQNKNVAIVIGSLFGGYNVSTHVQKKFLEGNGIEALTFKEVEYYSPCGIPNYLAKKFKIKGPTLVISNACASGGSAVGVATDLIRYNLVDMAIAGGTDELNQLSLAGFNSLNSISKEACRPYTKSAGITIGEGAGIFVLESLDDAKNRGSKPISEVMDYELNSDAFHVTAPDPNGDGAYRSISNILERNNISLTDLAYINGHGTGTPANDKAEVKAVKRLFANSEIKGKLTSNKAHIGHCMGAAGAIELIASVDSFRSNNVSPTYSEGEVKENRDVHIVTKTETLDGNVVISNSFAFGGNNVSVAVASVDYCDQLNNNMQAVDDEIVITGIGCIGNKHKSFEEYKQLLEKCDIEFLENDNYKGKYQCVHQGVIPEYNYAEYMSPDFYRRTDTISKLSMISSAEALKNAQLVINKANTNKVGLVYGTGTGPMLTIAELNGHILKQGLAGMNAFSFPNSVNNAAPGYITMNSKIKGSTITIEADGATLVSSIIYAKILLSMKKVDHVVVTVADDYCEIYHAAYDKLGYLSKNSRSDSFFQGENNMILASGSVSFVLEREKTAEERGCKKYAKVKSGILEGNDNSIMKLSIDNNKMYRSIENTLEKEKLSLDDLDVYFTPACGIGITDRIENRNIVSKIKDKVKVSSARPFVGYNRTLLPAYSLVSALIALNDGPLYTIENNQFVKTSEKINNALIGSYSFGETFANIIVSR